MRTIYRLLLLLFFPAILTGQRINFDEDPNKSLFIKLYGEAHFNKTFEKDIRHNGVFDLHRIVPLIGYQFNKNTQFVTEIEFEHGNEIFVEQAFIKHKLASNFHLRTGMILVPMGIVNVNHEPTAFNGVERPLVDKHIIPSTWRGYGLGFSGLIPDLSLKYQFYAIEGMRSYKDGATISNSSPVRSARQKGLKSIQSKLPSFSTQVEYFGISNLKTAVSYFGGTTQTTLNQGLDLTDPLKIAQADSSTMQLHLATFQMEYAKNVFGIKAQASYGRYLGTDIYNQFTYSTAPDSFYGYYIEPAYNKSKDGSIKWTAFGRYSRYDTSWKESIENGLENTAVDVYTLGFQYFFAKGVVGKLDYKFMQQVSWTRQFNMGIGVWF